MTDEQDTNEHEELTDEELYELENAEDPDEDAYEMTYEQMLSAKLPRRSSGYHVVYIGPEFASSADDPMIRVMQGSEVTECPLSVWDALS